MRWQSVRTSVKRLVAVATIGTVAQLGCLPDGAEFRDAAGPEVEAGVRSVLNGLLDGLFAVVDPDASTGDTSTTP